MPAWLRSLREGKRPVAGESLAEPSSDEGLPPGSQTTPGPDSSSGFPGWLSGHGEATSDNEAVPDWLADLRGGKTSESAPAPIEEGEPAPELGNEDWMQRLGSEPQEARPEPTETAKLPDYELPAAEGSPKPPPEGLAYWLKDLQSPAPSGQEPPATSQDAKKMPDWLSGVPDLSAESRPTLHETEAPVPAESVPDWLDQNKPEFTSTETGTPAEGGASVPDWLSSLGSIPVASDSTPREKIPEWLSNLVEKSGSEPGTPETLSGSEPTAPSNPPARTPDWLSQLQAEAYTAEQVEKPKEELEAVPEEAASSKGTGPLPSWLAGIEKTTSSTSGTPALVVGNETTPPNAEGETAISMETPDWLSKLTPDQGTEKTAEDIVDQEGTENLETAELPAWVKAMRPVEAVVELKMIPLDEDQITELSGPLAGLRGVLPAKPGLGLLRKPPMYSSTLQVSDGQQRYAASLEKLVAGETQPHAVGTIRLPSNRLWRWCIAVLLFLAAGLPLASGVHIAPASLLLSSDKGATSSVIEGLPANIPVLVAFDYDPALSGELEVVAAPIMDSLLSKGTPLALISTSLTGPALAEHFLKTTPLVNVHQYQSGEQYVNLGYLAGGPAGMLYLADSLAEAMPVSVDGKSAWKSGPLEFIQSLSNFAAVIILTDNADTGRNWIEQVGPRLGNTPMLMVISAQAEPMIRPYFDSGQLKGLVSGLPDAEIYEQTYNRPGLADHYWNSFSVGMLLAELLIAAGAMMGIVADRLANRKDSRGEA